MYVLFEGIDTCGKTTQIERIAREHPEAVITREPGGTAFGRRARKILLEGNLRSSRAEVLLFLADRAEHYEEVIRPHRDALLISDRGFLSGIGYALANKVASMEELIAFNRFALQDDWPDRIVFFQTDEATLRERLSAKSTDGIEDRGIDYLLEVQHQMLRTLKTMQLPSLLIDARDDVDTIHSAIVKYLEL